MKELIERFYKAFAERAGRSVPRNYFNRENHGRNLCSIYPKIKLKPVNERKTGGAVRDDFLLPQLRARGTRQVLTVTADHEIRLVTPARNEERFIAKTLESMAAQTILPERWVIVDDGSTDETRKLSNAMQAASVDRIDFHMSSDRGFQRTLRWLSCGLSGFRHFP